MPNVTLYDVLIEGLILTLWDIMGKKIIFMNLNGNGKMDSILNILVHWKMFFGLDLPSLQFGLFESTQNLLNDFFWGTYLVNFD
jgi:hypothetical protein